MWAPPASKGQRPAGRCAPRAPARDVQEGRAPLPSRRHTGPCHVALSTPPGAWPPWLAGTLSPPLRPGWSPIRTRRHRSLLRHRPQPALATGSGASACRAPPFAARPLCRAPARALLSLPPPRTHAALPASPGLVLPVSLTPLDAELSITPSQGPHGDARCRKFAVASPCHPRVAVPRGNGAHGGAPQPPCCRNLWSSHLHRCSL